MKTRSIIRSIPESIDVSRLNIPEIYLKEESTDYRCTSAAINVALGKPSYQTDTENGRTADLAVDGNTSHHLPELCTHTIPDNTSWWVNLQQIFLIRSVKIFNRNDSWSYRLTNVELYVGFSDRGFQSREGFRPGEVGLSHTFELATPVYGQWVRITRNPPNGRLVLCEMEVEGVPYSAGNNFHFLAFQGYVHTGTAIEVKKVRLKLDCVSRCSKTKNCISTHYNKATKICSLFDSLAFKHADIENDVCDVNRIAITENSRAQLFET
ncbi:hypothetical protein DPMN_047545 [Dreissena polymorpha]|uniref:Apple domain-containing protein n=1 Tax=Dreissena polymorpha TaxID=45954 RepID=A0A9D4I368_DREPO|nr:hypothetical protein DPMN_047545 [Dreissena polymorpha]